MTGTMGPTNVVPRCASTANRRSERPTGTAKSIAGIAQQQHRQRRHRRRRQQELRRLAFRQQHQRRRILTRHRPMATRHRPMLTRHRRMLTRRRLLTLIPARQHRRILTRHRPMLIPARQHRRILTRHRPMLMTWRRRTLTRMPRRWHRLPLRLSVRSRPTARIHSPRRRGASVAAEPRSNTRRLHARVLQMPVSHASASAGVSATFPHGPFVSTA